MAIINRLSLKSGGGIVSELQRARFTTDEAHIFIGLGGTGIDSIRRLKTELYERVVPDSLDISDFPYPNIRFLGVDSYLYNITANENRMDSDTSFEDDLLPLDDKEYFSIYLSNDEILDSSRSIKEHPELNWAPKINPISFLNNSRVIPGTRMMARYLFMERSAAFIALLKNIRAEILEGSHFVQWWFIHVFSGFGGATGSGIYLDVCYLLRDVFVKDGSTILGYYFLPDVNLSIIPMSRSATREAVVKNGYAAMQELDYCMTFPENQGTIEQVYQNDYVIKWNRQPVDLCFLICSMDDTKMVIRNAYDYVMKLTAEFILNNIQIPNNNDFRLGSSFPFVWTYQRIVQSYASHKLHGFNIRYLSIGGSCVSVPIKKINTYLMAGLFESYNRVGCNVPTVEDVNSLVIDAWVKNDYYEGTIARLWESILYELRADTQNYSRFGDDKIYRNAAKEDSVFVEYYNSQKTMNMRMIRRNRVSMLDVENTSSYRNRLIHSMEAVLSDIERGPMFAHRMLSETNGYNIFDIISGLKAILADHKLIEQQGDEQRHDNFQESKDRFLKRPKKKNYLNYEIDLIALCEHEEQMCLYEEVEVFLEELEQQLVLLTDSFYLPLSQIFTNLRDTFRDNMMTLKRYTMNDESFDKPLITIEEIKETLDNEIRNVDIKNSYISLIRKLTEPENVKKWDNEDSIAKIINDFFTQDVFRVFTNKTITSFLEDKYQLTGDDLVRKIKADRRWMFRRSMPLFPFTDGDLYFKISEITKTVYIPEDSYLINSSIYNTADEQVVRSSMQDRISSISMYEAFPLSAYSNLSEYEQKYYSSYGPNPGMHIYEGSKRDEKGLDWTKLSSVTPLSMIPLTSDTIPQTLKENIERVEELYQEAIVNNLIIEDYDGSRLRFVRQSFSDRLFQLENEIAAFIQNREKMSSTIRQDRKKVFEERYEQLEEEFLSDDYLVNEPKVPLYWEGSNRPSVRQVIIKDNIYAAPMIQQMVQNTLNMIAEIEKKLSEIKAKIDKIDLL